MIPRTKHPTTTVAVLACSGRFRTRRKRPGSGANGPVDGGPELGAGDEAGVVLDADERGFRVLVVRHRNLRRVVHLERRRCRREDVSCLD